MPIPMRAGSPSVRALLAVLGLVILALTLGRATAAAQSLPRAATPPPDQVTVPAAPAPTTTTTLASIGDQFTPGPVTLPLRTKGSNGHVDPLFAWLSGIGFALGLLMVAARLVITRSGGRDRAPLT